MSGLPRFLKLGRYGARNTMQSRLAFVATSRQFLTLPSTITQPFHPLSRQRINETRTFSTSKVPKDAKIPTPEPTIGYELVLDRSVKIMVNVAERAMTSVLHTYCDARFIDYLGTNSNFDIIGCSDRQTEVDNVRELKQYSQCDLVTFSLSLPYRPKQFQFVINVVPPIGSNPHYPTSPTPNRPMPSPSEILRVLSDNGYALIGADEAMWTANNVMAELQTLDEAGEMSMLSLQMLPLEQGGSYYLALIKAC